MIFINLPPEDIDIPSLLNNSTFNRHNLETYKKLKDSGYSFKLYRYNLSAVLISSERVSKIHLTKNPVDAVFKGLPYSLIALICGWWAIPHGPITNFKGGIDVSKEVLDELEAQSNPCCISET